MSHSLNGKHQYQKKKLVRQYKRKKVKTINPNRALTLCLLALFIANISNIFAYFTAKDTISNEFSFNNSYTVTFHANDGTDATTTQTIPFNTATNLDPNPFTRTNYSFLEWTTNPDGTGAAYQDRQSVTNLTTPEVGNINLYARWVEGVARIDDTLYTTLHDAINAVPANKGTTTTITLLRDISEHVTINPNVDITLDLNNHTISSSIVDRIFFNKGKLTVKNGTLTSSVQNAIIDNESTGTLVVTDGARLLATGNRGAIYNNKGKLEINGDAYISSKTDERATIQNLQGGNVLITGGQIISEQSSAVKNDGTMTIGVKDGNADNTTPELQGFTYGIESSKDFNLYDGIMKGKNKAISNETKVVDKETGLDIVHTGETISGAEYDVAYLGIPKIVTFNANGGNVDPTTRKVDAGKKIGKLPVPTYAGFEFAGWFTSTTGGEQIGPNTIIEDDITYYARWTPKDVAKINGTLYKSIKLAIAAVPENEETTITIISDTKEKFSVPANKNIVLDINNHTINNVDNNSDAVLTNYGTTKIISGTISTSSTAVSAINNKPGGNLIITGGNIISTGKKQALHNDGGTVEITGTAYLSSVAPERPGVTNLNNATMTISGGTIESTKQQAVVNEGLLTISGNPTLNSTSTTVAAFTNSGTATITGGTIVSKSQDAVSNSGTLTIGTKDGTIDTTTPTMQGATYGITNTSTFNFYDGIIKGITDTIQGTISDIEDNSEQIDSQEVIGDTTYNTTTLGPIAQP